MEDFAFSKFLRKFHIPSKLLLGANENAFQTKSYFSNPGMEVRVYFQEFNWESILNHQDRLLGSLVLTGGYSISRRFPKGTFHF